MTPSEGAGQAMREELERVLASSGFARNPRLSRFLRFLVERHLEGKDDEIKETLIAVEVFGRKPDYDPKLDSIVRTEAGRLRARLVEYYASDGRENPGSIDVPKGAYVPVFRPAARHEVRRSHRAWFIARTAACAALVVGVVALDWWYLAQRRDPIRIAVLPLENLSQDAAQDYFADGLTDELIRNLSIIDGLAVRSQTSSFAYHGKRGDVRQAGAQLQVDYVLEGSVRRAGHRLRINMQLVRVHDDVSLWSDTFERELTDVFAIQDEISRHVVNHLRLHLGRGRRRYETSVQAYDLYLEGRAMSVRHGLRGVLESIGPFEQAVVADPSFTPAYAGLGAAYALRSIQFPLAHPPDELVKMRAAAAKAVELDPLLAEAHEARALAYARDSRWGEAEESFRRAIALDPNRSATYTDFALWLLHVLGRNHEALGQLRMAQKADALSPDVHLPLAMTLTSTGEFEQAAAECLKMPMEYGLAKQCLARARLGEG